MVRLVDKQGRSWMNRTFGQEIRELRREKNLGQRAVASAVGINFTYLS
jgi:hypothetical protein